MNDKENISFRTFMSNILISIIRSLLNDTYILFFSKQKWLVLRMPNIVLTRRNANLPALILILSALSELKGACVAKDIYSVERIVSSNLIVGVSTRDSTWRWVDSNLFKWYACRFICNYTIFYISEANILNIN